VPKHSCCTDWSIRETHFFDTSAFLRTVLKDRFNTHQVLTNQNIGICLFTAGFENWQRLV